MTIRSNKFNILKSNGFYFFLFGIMAVFVLLRALNYHKINRIDYWKGENFADAGGYYSHLIMWFDLGYESKNYPSNLQKDLGYGVTTDSSRVATTKYTCGVAYLLTPFYLGNRLLGGILGYETKAESLSNKKMIDYAAAFYLWAGAVFLFLFLVRYYKKWIVFLAILATIFGTNIPFYASVHVGMSHIYSFFLVSLYLYSATKYLETKKIKWLILLGISGAIIILIRPINVIFLPIIFFLNDAKIFLSIFTKPKLIFIILMAFIIALLPQFIYWYEVSGKIIYYSYNQEGFTQWKKPKIAFVLFSPDNGMLLYNPFILLIIAGTIWAAIKKYGFAIYYFLVFAIMVYLSASWHQPNFGCGYGQRNFVDILGAGVFPLCMMMEKIVIKRKYLVLALLLIIAAIFVAYNIRILIKYEPCSFLFTPWGWEKFWHYVW